MSWWLPDWGGECGEMGKKGKALRNSNWLLQNSHGDVKYSIENIVNNSLITMYGVRWCEIYQDDHLSYVMSYH